MSSDKELFKKMNKTIDAEAAPDKDSLYGDEGSLIPDADLADTKAGFKEEQRLEDEYGDNTASALGLGALRGATLGVSDHILSKTGIVSQEALREIKARNSAASTTGDVLSTAALLLASGGAAGAAKAGAAVVGRKAVAKGIAKKIARTASAPIRGIEAAGLASEKLAQKALSNVLKDAAKDSIAKKIVQKSIPKMLGSGVEGAIFAQGELISEHALDNAEMSAENILATAGIGGLMGVAAGGIFEAPKALAPIGKKIKPKMNALGEKVLNKFGDVKEASLDIIGAKPSTRTFLKKNKAQFVEELPDFLVEKAKMGKWTSDAKLYDNVLDLKDKAGSKIGSIIKEVDELGLKTPGMLSTKREVFARQQSKIQAIIDDHIDIPEWESAMPFLRKYRDSYGELARKRGNITAKDLHDRRMLIDKEIRYSKGFENFNKKEMAMTEIRDSLNDEIFKVADNAYAAGVPGIADTLKAANKDYSYSATLLPLLAKQVDSAAAKRGIFSMSDMMVGGFGLAGDSLTAGGTLLVGKKLWESNLRRRLQILKSVEKQNQIVSKKIDFGVKSFFKGKASAAKLTSVNALVNSNLSIDQESKKKPKTKAEAFKNIKNNLVELTTNPEKFQKRMIIRTAHLVKEAPQTTAFATATAQAGVQFLMTKLPKPLTNPGTKNAFTKREWGPSETQMAKFQRYVETVENPMSIVEDLESGTITREAAEALQIVYPRIFQQIQEKVMDSLSSSEEVVPYNKRLQLGILLNIPTDESLQPEAIKGLQDNFIPAEEQQQIDSDDIERSNREQTLNQQMLTRE